MAENYRVRRPAGTSEPMKVATALSFAPLSPSEGMEQESLQQQQQESSEGKHGLAKQVGKGDDSVQEEGGCCLSTGSPTLMSLCRLDTFVTVLDASTFKADMQSIEEMADRFVCRTCCVQRMD